MIEAPDDYPHLLRSVLALEKGVQIACAVDEHEDMDLIVVHDSVDEPVTLRDDQFP